MPHIGAKLLQKLKSAEIEEWHGTLRVSGRVRGNGDLSARTIGHAHRVLGKALSEAARHGLVVKNVVALEAAPKVPNDEMEIVQDVPALIEKIRGHRLFAMGMVGLLTGMRLGEVLALRWSDISFEAKTLTISRAIEQTRKYGRGTKEPKTARGVRTIAIDDTLIDLLRRERDKHRRLAAGVPDDSDVDRTRPRQPRLPILSSALRVRQRGRGSTSITARRPSGRSAARARPTVAPAERAASARSSPGSAGP